MTEEQRRSIRVRHPPRVYNSQLGRRSAQEEEGENYASLPNPQRKEVKQSIPPTTTISKLLVNFINQANLNYRQYKKSSKRQKNDKEQKEVSEAYLRTPKSNLEREAPRKNIANGKKEDDKKPREPYSYKGGNTEPDKIKAQIQTQRYANTHLNPKNNMTTLQDHSYLTHQLNQLDQMYPCIKQCVGAYSQDPSNANASIPALVKHQMMMKQMLQGRLAIQSRENLMHGLNPNIFLTNTPKQITDGKLFKRSSYHVAIAYHIYLKKIQNNLSQSSNIIDADPTHFARKLRQQKFKEVEANELPQQPK